MAQREILKAYGLVAYTGDDFPPRTHASGSVDQDREDQSVGALIGMMSHLQ